MLNVPADTRSSPTSPLAAFPKPAGNEAVVLDEIKRWDYVFTFNSPSSDQDTRYITVTFNGPSLASRSRAGLRAGNLDPLFDSLAQFTSVYPALQTDLGLLPGLSPGTNAAVAANAVSVFADLVHRVANAFAPVARSHALVAGPDVITLAYKVTVDGNVMTLRLATPPPASIGWPDLEAHGKPMIGANVGPTATTRAYTYPSGVVPTTPDYLWRFNKLDVTLLQSGVTAAWVVRNQNLGRDTGQDVNGHFVYQTAVAEFASPVMPLLISQLEVPIGRSGQPVADAVASVFADLFGPVPGPAWSTEVKLAARYGYGLGTGAITALLPIFIISRTSVTSESLSAFATEVDQLLETWTAREKPNPAQGMYVLDLTVYAALSSAAGLPVLDIENLEYALSS
jgi:hypothetical protein